MLRFEYLKKYFDREREFIGTFYERKGSRSGKFIYKRIEAIEEDVVEEVMFLYLLMKQKRHMMTFYEEKVEYTENKIKFSKTLQRKLLSDAEGKRRRGAKREAAQKPQGLQKKPSPDSASASRKSGKRTGPTSPGLAPQLQPSATSNQPSDARAPQAPASQGRGAMAAAGAVDDVTRWHVERYGKFIEADQAAIEVLLAKKRKCARDASDIEQHLFSGTDPYIKADQSVKASFRQAQEDLERKYPGEKVDFKELAEQFSAKNKVDVYGDGQDPNANPYQKEEAKSSRRTTSSKSSNVHGSERRGGGSKRCPKKKPEVPKGSEGHTQRSKAGSGREKNLPADGVGPVATDGSELNPEAALDGKDGGAPPRPPAPPKKSGGFSLQVQREDIHRMIFKCCSYDRAAAKALWFSLEPARREPSEAGSPVRAGREDADDGYWDAEAKLQPGSPTKSHMT